MIDQIKVVKGFMSQEDSLLISQYARSIDVEFSEFGNGEKEFTFHASFEDDNIKDLINYIY
jgi:hypothetical protein